MTEESILPLRPTLITVARCELPTGFLKVTHALLEGQCSSLLPLGDVLPGPLISLTHGWRMPWVWIPPGRISASAIKITSYLSELTGYSALAYNGVAGPCILADSWRLSLPKLTS